MNLRNAHNPTASRNRRSGVITACSVLLFAAALPLQAFGQAPTDAWRFSLMPYVWLPSLDGTLRYGFPPDEDEPTPIEVDADTLLGAIDSVLMLSGEVRNDQWVVATDFIYLDLKGDRSAASTIDPGEGTPRPPGIPGLPNIIGNVTLEAAGAAELSGGAWTLIGGRVLTDSERGNFAVVGGIRLFELDASVDYRVSATIDLPGGPQTRTVDGTLGRGGDLLDFIVGVRGRVALGDSAWFAPYHFDVGTGDSDLTWQGVLGVGRSFGWGDVILAYRHLSYERDDENSLIKDLRLSGFGAGANFRF
jgi:hypothetical protein